MVEEHRTNGKTTLDKVQGAFFGVGKDLGMDTSVLGEGIRNANIREVMASGSDIHDDTNFVGNPSVHDPVTVELPYHHCPPLPFIPPVFQCNCEDWWDVCCLTGDWTKIKWEEHLESAERYAEIDSPSRLPNNLMRKGLYRDVYFAMDIGQTYEEMKKRVVLPVCAVAKVRQIYPNADGNYMGYRES